MRKHRFSSYVAGVSFHQCAVAGCHEGQPVRLRRNPNNPHDKNAIEVHAGGSQIGFIPRDEAETLAELVDGSDWTVKARIDRFYGGDLEIDGEPIVGVGLLVTYQRVRDGLRPENVLIRYGTK